MSEGTAAVGGRLRAAFRTDPGRLRSNNEDVPLVDSQRGVYGVIDGVGGHAAGEVAAAIACDVILQRLARPLGTPAERVREAIAIANNEIYRRAQGSPELFGMTCVVTLAVVTDGRLTIGHVGDTRLYKLRPGGIRKLTHDHSPVGEREDAQEITELEAMRHPRRHEVFRDVGSAYRDKDEEDYVEVIEERFERDAAILLCSDGLTDLVASAAIDRIVRQHAGDPEAVVEALVGAANEAGGRDNVTVVYAESAGFAAANPGRLSAAVPGAASDSTPEPAAYGTQGRGEGGESDAAGARAERPRGRVSTYRRAIVRSRATWFVLGAVLGIAAALGFVWRLAGTDVAAGRTILVGADTPGAVPRIAAAMDLARPGDLISVEPGVYRERVLLADGVSLEARVPDTVTLARELGAEGEWIALETLGLAPRRISGIRIESTSELPVDTGLRISAQGAEIERLELSGPMRTGIELLPDSAMTMHGSHFAIGGTGVVAGERAEAVAAGNVFVRTDRAGDPPIVKAATAHVALRRNVFAGYGTEIVQGAVAAERQEIAAANVVMAAEMAR